MDQHNFTRLCTHLKSRKKNRDRTICLFFGFFGFEFFGSLRHELIFLFKEIFIQFDFERELCCCVVSLHFLEEVIEFTSGFPSSSVLQNRK
jgi:hypothetical protein